MTYTPEQLEARAVHIEKQIETWKGFPAYADTLRMEVFALRLAAEAAGRQPSPDIVRKAAQAVIDRWDTPAWKDVPATAIFVNALRDALASTRAPDDSEDRMIKIEKLIADMQSIKDRFGNTCVYIRRGGLSWGAVALNRRDADEKHGVFELQAQHDRDMQQQFEQVERLKTSRDRAEIEANRLRDALEKLASRHITDTPLWWQEEARAAIEGRKPWERKDSAEPANDVTANDSSTRDAP